MPYCRCGEEASERVTVQLQVQTLAMGHLTEHETRVILVIHKQTPDRCGSSSLLLSYEIHVKNLSWSLSLSLWVCLTLARSLSCSLSLHIFLSSVYFFPPLYPSLSPLFSPVPCSFSMFAAWPLKLTALTLI